MGVVYPVFLIMYVPVVLVCLSVHEVLCSVYAAVFVESIFSTIYFFIIKLCYKSQTFASLHDNTGGRLDLQIPGLKQANLLIN